MSDGDFAARRDALLRGYGVLPPASEPAGEAYWRARAVQLEEELARLRASKAYRVVRSLGRAARLASRALPGGAGRTGAAK